MDEYTKCKVIFYTTAADQNPWFKSDCISWNVCPALNKRSKETVCLTLDCQQLRGMLFT